MQGGGDRSRRFRSNDQSILLHRKGDVADLERYIPISLLNHLYKLYTQIVTERLETKLYFYQPRDQAGFRPKYGTNDHLQFLKTMIEENNKYNRSSAFFLRF